MPFFAGYFEIWFGTMAALVARSTTDAAPFLFCHKEWECKFTDFWLVHCMPKCQRMVHTQVQVMRSFFSRSAHCAELSANSATSDMPGECQSDFFQWSLVDTMGA
jgi:hypothetical protein